jgi:hypothetical protein
VLDAYEGQDGFIGQRALERLGSIAATALDDEVAPAAIVERVQYVAFEAFARGWFDGSGSEKDLSARGLNSLSTIGKKAIAKRRRDVIESVVGSIAQIGCQAAQLHLDRIVGNALWGLRELWIIAYESEQAEVLVLLAYPVGLIGKVVVEVGVDPDNGNDAKDIATVRANLFIRTTEFDRPERPPGREGTPWTTVDMLREIGGLLRNSGRSSDLENVVGWLREIGEIAGGKGLATLAEDTARVVRELGKR